MVRVPKCWAWPLLHVNNSLTVFLMHCKLSALTASNLEFDGGWEECEKWNISLFS